MNTLKKLRSLAFSLILMLQLSGIAPFMGTQVAKAADTGFLTPTSTHSDTGWDDSTVTKVQTSDNVYATDNDGDEQDWSNFNFPTIPAGSTIDGVEVRVEAKSSDSSGCDMLVRVSWNNNGNNTSSKTAGIDGSDDTYIFGGSTDKWGRTWSPNDFTNPNFVLRISAEEDQGNCSNNATTSYDLIQAKVYYTAPALPSDLTVEKTNNVAGSVLIGSTFDWTLTVINNGAGSVSFDNQNILQDNLPTNASYSNTSLLSGGGLTGTVDCTINSSNLDCDDNNGGSSVVIPSGGWFSVTFTVTPDEAGSYINPRSGGSNMCKVDPDNLKSESNEDNNTCSDTVTVTNVAPIANPVLGDSCGLDIALVLDNSGSIDAGELAAMKSAMTAFTAAFAGTPTHFSVTKFATTGSVVQNFTANITDVNSAINAIPEDEGSTNWEDGLLKAQSTLNHRTNPNLVVFASDGNPNRVDNGTTAPEAQAVNEAVLVANSIKSINSSRIIALGIGGGLDTANLEAISSADAVITSDFAALAQTLADLASELCGGTVTVTKLVDADGDITTTDDQTVASGWDFTIDGTTVTTDVNGIAPSVEVDPGTYSVTETVKTGYTVIGADCKISDQSVGSWVSGATLSNLAIDATDIVTCTFVNSELAEVTLNKEVASGNASANSFNLYIGGTQVTNGQASTTFSPGSYIVTEDQLEGYVMTSYYGDCYTSKEDTFLYIDISLGQSVTCTLVNNKLPTITLVKTVSNTNGGQATANDFQAYIDDEEVEWNTLVTVNSVGEYMVSESTLNGYVTGEWGGDCDSDGNVTLDYAQNAVCTITNSDEASTVTVGKYIHGDTDNSYQFNIGYTSHGEPTTDEFTLSGWDTTSFDVDANAPVTISEETSSMWNTQVECYASNESLVWAGKASELTFETELGIDYYCDFYNLEAGTVTITKFNDRNKNGSWDTGEEKLSGWDMQANVTYFSTEEDTEANGVVSGTTGEDGSVTLNMLEFMSLSGEGYVEYDISETNKVGWVQTALYCDDVVYPWSENAAEFRMLDLAPLVADEAPTIHDGYATGGTSQQCYIGNYKKPITAVLSDTITPPAKTLSTTGAQTAVPMIVAGTVMLISLLFAVRREEEVV